MRQVPLASQGVDLRTNTRGNPNYECRKAKQNLVEAGGRLHLLLSKFEYAYHTLELVHM